MEFYEEIKDEIKKIKESCEYPNEGVAFGHFCLKECFLNNKIIYKYDMDDDTVKSYIVDGINDMGLDSIIIDEDEKQLHLFQFKFSERPLMKSSDIEKSFNIIEYIMQNTNFDPNKKIKTKIDEFLKVCKKDELKQNWELIYYFVDNKNDDDLKNQFKNSLDDYYQKYNVDNKNIKASFFDYKYLSDLYKDNPMPKNKFELTLQNNLLEQEEKYYHEDSDTYIKIKVIICFLSLKSLYKMYKEKKNTLFELNVRYGKTNKTNVNNEILTELKKGDKSNFQYYNNGITAICKSYQVKDNILNIENIQIINGAQTTSSIGKLDEEKIDKLENKYISAKINVIENSVDIEKYKEISAKITKCLNSQNPINGRALVANNENLNYLQKEFKKYNILFSKKDGESKGNMKEVINNIDLGKAYLTFFKKIPASGAGKVKLVFSDEYFKDIFKDEKKQVIKLLFPYRILQLCKEICKENIPNDEGETMTLMDTHSFLRETLDKFHYLLFFSNIYFGREFLEEDPNIDLDKLVEKIDEKDFSIYFKLDKDNEKSKLDEDKIKRNKFRSFIEKLVVKLSDKLDDTDNSEFTALKLRNITQTKLNDMYRNLGNKKYLIQN